MRRDRGSDDGDSLEIVNRECCLSSFRGRLSIRFEDGERDDLPFPLFDGKPLIFELRTDWNGNGRRVHKITDGYFVVIVPNDWRRKGHAPVERQGCTDRSFTAHYFYRSKDGTAEDVGGFEGYDFPLTAAVKLSGESAFDDSEKGELFVGNTPPKLTPAPGVVWARVGEEEEGDGGWKGENFNPAERSLAEVLNGRQGWFFVRVYDAEPELMDSVEFRYLRGLREILVNGERYGEHTLLVPLPTGYPPTTVRFSGADGAIVRPIPLSETMCVDAREDSLIVPPHRDADRISCVLESDAGRVDIELTLPRIWWRMEHEEGEPGAWRDTSLEMTRQEFRRRADEKAAIWLSLPQRVESAAIGFDNELNQKLNLYKKNGNDVEIRLDDFVDHKQIDRPLNEEASLNIGCGEYVSTLIRVAADPAPEIVSFTSEPAAVFAGDVATLRWTTRHAEPGSVAIHPGIDSVESSGNLDVTPLRTTTYRLTLGASDTNNVTMAVTVAVNGPPRTGETLFARVPRANHGSRGWRRGKGFSRGELQAVPDLLGESAFDDSEKGKLFVGDATAGGARRSIPIDGRRRSMHRVNVETLGRLVDD